MNIGFIGLGIMGTPMAGHILAAGHQLHVNTTGDVPKSLLNENVKVCATAREVAAASEMIFIMVPDTPHVESVLFAKNGCAEADLDNKIIIDMSSISPMETKIFANKIRQLGGEYLDAPVSGGEVGAKQASLTIMVGGKPGVFNQVKPLFELMGKNITLIGDNGDGQTCKVANQIIVALTIEAVSEALLFAAKAGANPETVKNALMGGFASSRILEVHGERMIKRNFEPGFKIVLHQKDLKLALQGASTLGISLPNTATCQELFNSCIANGNGNLDHSAMVNALELMANYKIRH